MPFVTTKDKTEIFYKGAGDPSGKPVVFSHGWPLNSDNWENQMFFLGQHGYHVVAHDSRGHGRSSQPWGRTDIDTYSDGLLAVFEHLDIEDAMLVGHSTGGEVIRFLGRHGTSRVSKAVIVGAIPVLILHGELDQIVPIKASALEGIKLLQKGTLKVYPGGAHALPNTAVDEVNEDLLAFLKS